jgi:hypothetical protein
VEQGADVSSPIPALLDKKSAIYFPKQSRKFCADLIPKKGMLILMIFLA